MTQVKWAVLGSCGIARRRTIPEGICRAANAGLVAIYDIDKAANRALARELQVEAAPTEHALLTGPADVIYIATPARRHHRQIRAAAQAGKHVFCEKPLGLTVRQAAGSVAACQSAGVKLGVGFMMRFLAQHQEALKLIQQGKLGTPVYGRAQLSCWYPPIAGAWRQDPRQGGGGSLIDMGGHCIDLLEMFFGPARRVSCFAGRRVHGYASEDSAVALIEFTSGAFASVDTFFNIPDASSRNRLELYGSNGSILAEGTIGQASAGRMTAYLEAAGVGYDAQQQRQGDAGIAIEPSPVNPYQAEVEAFSQAILEGREPVVSGAAGEWSQRVLAACYASARKGRAIEVT